MKKLIGFLFSLAIVSTLFFTSCKDYVNNRLPPYNPEAGNWANFQQFDNVVAGKTWYTQTQDTGKNTTEQIKLFFDVRNHTFIRELYTWDTNYDATPQNTNKRISSTRGRYVIRNGGEMAFAYTDEYYHNISQYNVISYSYDTADGIKLNGKLHVSDRVLGKAYFDVIDRTTSPTWSNK